MTRYQCLRRMGCGWFTAAGVAFGNWLRGNPEGIITFLTVVIEYDPEEA